MGRPKGSIGTKRIWTKEEKLKAVQRVIENNETQEKVRKELNINSGLLHAWIKKYLKEGEKGLETKRTQKCPYNGLHLKKELNDLEKLQLENMKLKVENERLKKGYIVEGDGQSVIFDKSKFKNSK